jgi:hypothetical protein
MKQLEAEAEAAAAAAAAAAADHWKDCYRGKYLPFYPRDIIRDPVATACKRPGLERNCDRAEHEGARKMPTEGASDSGDDFNEPFFSPPLTPQDDRGICDDDDIEGSLLFEEDDPMFLL